MRGVSVDDVADALQKRIKPVERDSRLIRPDHAFRKDRTENPDEMRALVKL